MIKVRLWGEPVELEMLIERICNDLPGVRVLSVSKHYKDRGASVYERCYLDVTLNEQPVLFSGKTDIAERRYHGERD